MTNWIKQEALKVYLSLPNQEVDRGQDLAEQLTPLEISRTSGGRQLDYAVFDYNLGYTGEHVENLSTPLDWALEVEIWAKINGQDKPIFWGDLTIQDVQITGTERVTVTARILPYHFGDISEGVSIPNYIDDPPSFVKIRGNIEFNPLVDGEIINNRANEKGDAGPGTDVYYLWLDPDSLKTTTASNFNNDNNAVATWDLKEAINSLCWEMNPFEDFIKNPDLDSYTEIFDDAPDLRNISMPRGRHLPDYLDSLLLPLGYNWYVELSVDADSKMERRLKIFKRADGEEKTLKIARLGDAADFDTTDTGQAAVVTDIGATINKIVAHGDFQRREITVELYRAWPESDDSESLSNLEYGEDGTLTKPAVWRKFVANEAGDYCSTRTTTQPIPATPLDLSSVFEDYIPRRRKFFRPLTKDADGEIMDVYIEYYDGSYWYPLPEEHVGEVKILQNEMGVYFAGASPPSVLYDIGADLKIRVTGTVVGDKPIVYEVEDTETSPNSRPSPLFLDLSDRFMDAQVETSGTFASQLEVIVGSASFGHDDTTDMQTFVDAVLAVEKSAVMDCNFSLMGLNANYAIGDLLTKIEGREISLDRNSVLAAEPRYPQVVGLVYRPQDNQTRLLIDTNEGI